MSHLATSRVPRDALTILAPGYPPMNLELVLQEYQRTLGQFDVDHLTDPRFCVLSVGRTNARVAALDRLLAKKASRGPVKTEGALKSEDSDERLRCWLRISTTQAITAYAFRWAFCRRRC
jgi:hypothetical protein